MSKFNAMNGVYVQYYPNSLRSTYINIYIIDIDVASMQCTGYSHSTPDTPLFKSQITEISEDKAVCKDAGMELHKKNDETLVLKPIDPSKSIEVFYYKIPRKQFDAENNPILKSDKIYDINSHLFFLHEDFIEIPSGYEDSIGLPGGKHPIAQLLPIHNVSDNCLEYRELANFKIKSYCED